MAYHYSNIYRMPYRLKPFIRFESKIIYSIGSISLHTLIIIMIMILVSLGINDIKYYMKFPILSISGESFDYFMNFFGKCFVRFFTNFGYDKMLKATGRYFCDFLQSVDNIHLQMRFTYPKMKSPSMQLTETDENGAVLIYRSGRSGFSR